MIRQRRHETRSLQLVSDDPRQRALMLPEQDVQPFPLPASGEAEREVIDLRAYWMVLVRRKWVVLSFFFLTLLATLIGTFLATPVYRSSVTLQIEREADKVVNFDNVGVSDSGSSQDFYQTQYELLQSRTLAKRVIEQLGLARSGAASGNSAHKGAAAATEHGLGGIVTRLKSRLQPAEEQPAAAVTPAARPEDAFLSNLTVEPVRRSRLVKVHYDSANPGLAAKVVNALVDAFINLNLERRFDASAYAKTFLAEQIKQVKANLEDSERRLVNYATAQQIINVDDKQHLLMQQLQEMNRALAEATAKRIAAEAEFQSAAQGGAMTLVALEDGAVAGLRANLAELKSDYQENLSIYKPAYPKMRRLQERIDQVERDLAREKAAVVQALEASYRSALAEEKILTQKVEEAKQAVLGLESRSVEYKTLQREVRTNRELYDGLLQRIKEVGVAAGAVNNNISVVDPGEVPSFPFKPSLKKNMLIALLVGLFGGVGLAFLFEHLDDTLKTEEDVERALGLSTLGVIPVQAGQDAGEESVGMLIHADPTSALAEAYRSLRTTLMFSTASGAPKVLHFTSSSAGEGKTTSAIGAAITFAQARHKVLLVDADLRNPSLHKAFRIDNSIGLTQYIAGGASPSEIARATRIPQLYLVTSGPIPPNPAELLSSGKMMDLLSLASERFDYVVVDGPPVLGLADAPVLASLAEGTVLVAETGVARATAVENSVKRLRGANAHLIGCLLSKHGKGGSGYGYGYDYQYSYSYGANELEGPQTRRKLPS